MTSYDVQCMKRKYRYETSTALIIHALHRVLCSDETYVGEYFMGAVGWWWKPPIHSYILYTTGGYVPCNDATL